jgi:hypothetical protein
MLEHPEEPIFHGSAIKTFDNVKNSWWFSLTVRNGFLDPRVNSGIALQKYRVPYST